MAGLTSGEIALLGFVFVVLTAALSAVGNYVAGRVGTRKDIILHEKRLNKHSEELDECVDEAHCDERRNVFSRDIRRVEETVKANTQEVRTVFDKFDKKLDKIVLNGKNGKQQGTNN